MEDNIDKIKIAAEVLTICKFNIYIDGSASGDLLNENASVLDSQRCLRSLWPYGGEVHVSLVSMNKKRQHWLQTGPKVLNDGAHKLLVILYQECLLA